MGGAGCRLTHSDGCQDWHQGPGLTVSTVVDGMCYCGCWVSPRPMAEEAGDGFGRGVPCRCTAGGNNCR